VTAPPCECSKREQVDQRRLVAAQPRQRGVDVDAGQRRQRRHQRRRRRRRRRLGRHRRHHLARGVADGHQPRQHRNQLLDVDRLGHVGIHAGFGGAAAVVFEHVGGHRNDRQRQQAEARIARVA
jgi:hypothetical protein